MPICADPKEEERDGKNNYQPNQALVQEMERVIMGEDMQVDPGRPGNGRLGRSAARGESR